MFFAFDTAVIPALRRQPGPAGLATMNAINVVILNPLFLLLFVGTTLCCAAQTVLALFADEPNTGWRVAGGAVYVLGVFVVTMAVNVPLNDALAEPESEDSGGERLWDTYLVRWTRWNHIRTVASLAASVILVLAASL